MRVLEEAEVHSMLQSLPGWKLKGSAIQKDYTFPSFLEGVAFVNKVADHAEKADHHPDILISYRRVTLTLSTHSAGGITEKDLDLARGIEAIA